ncbi:MerR family transcriptional regulator [Jiangella asiatica]|uniref:MerR family transcriptional regulator n=1 Tax=Jiangella asiatica TaxID=2530372 RepID=A0A4R5DBE2_9ACTN|nr:MerR family transcriptional regulator [Jiangella asiatica]TDE10979.1 MerR family transcriptional regulator [Jiangella asiatica]
MRIGDLAKRAGTTTRALRFYEAQGLLSARRSSNGYREYDEDDVRVVEEILMLQRIGFSLDETRPFIDCLRAGNDSGDVCAPSIETYERKLVQLDASVDRLTATRDRLSTMLSSARARSVDTQES